MLLVQGGQTHDVLELVELAGDVARVRTAFLFELGEELRVRFQQDGKWFEAPAWVRAHVPRGDDKLTELELGERSEAA
jgi:hypothetical protein